MCKIVYFSKSFFNKVSVEETDWLSDDAFGLICMLMCPHHSARGVSLFTEEASVIRWVVITLCDKTVRNLKMMQKK